MTEHTRNPGGPVHSGRRILSTPECDIIFGPDLSDEQIQEFVARFNAARQVPAQPVDLSWLTPQPPETWLQRQPVWRILAAVFSGITLFFAAMIAIAVATGAL